MVYKTGLVSQALRYDIYLVSMAWLSLTANDKVHTASEWRRRIGRPARVRSVHARAHVHRLDPDGLRVELLVELGAIVVVVVAAVCATTITSRAHLDALEEPSHVERRIGAHRARQAHRRRLVHLQHVRKASAQLKARLFYSHTHTKYLIKIKLNLIINLIVCIRNI